MRQFIPKSASLNLARGATLSNRYASGRSGQAFNLVFVGSNPTRFTTFDGERSLIGKAPDCETGRCEFESRRSHQHSGSLAQRQSTRLLTGEMRVRVLHGPPIRGLSKLTYALPRQGSRASSILAVRTSHRGFSSVD